MKMKMKRFLGLFLSLALVLGMFPGMSLTAYAANNLTIEIMDDLENMDDYEWGYQLYDGDVSIAEGTYVQINMGTWHTDVMKIYMNGEVVYTKPSGSLYKDDVYHFTAGKNCKILGGNQNMFDWYTNPNVYITQDASVAVTGVTLNPNTAQTIDVGGSVAFTATVKPDDATDRKVKWSATGGVTLYTDQDCTEGNEVGTDATDTLTVYAKGISAGSATVTCTSNADSEKKASCDVTVNAAQTQTEELLTTITATGKEQASYSVENVATVSFSYTENGYSYYTNNGTTATWGWWGYGWKATVAPAEGYTITKCVFYDDKDRTATDSEAPFVVETTEEDKTPQVNGTPILAYQSKGITKIEVYGYATPTATHSVTITAGDHMTKTAGSGAASQTGLSGAMTDVVYTADDGYYFPENYSVAAVNGISVTRNSYTQITVSGTPSADATITLTAPTAKTTPAAPTTAAATDCTTADNNDGKLTGVTAAMEYKKSDAADWTAGTGSDITGLVPGTYYVRVKATETTNASTNQELTIKGFISYTVTFKVVNGKWNEGEGDAATADKTVTLTGHEGDTLKLAADQIPAVGNKPNDTYKAGSWDVTPSTDTAITAATTYTYTYAQKDAAVVTKAPAAKTLTYTGSVQELVTAGEAEGGDMYYALGTETEATEQYTTSIPTGTKAGTYYLWVKAIGDENHEDSAAACVTVEIGKKAITISGITAADKTYDKTTAATLDYTGIDWTACGMVAGDALTITANGAFADVNAETGKTVNISGLTLGGSSIANYELAASGQQTTTTANIDKKAVTITADDKSSKYKEAILELTYQITSGSILSGDDLGITLSTTATSSSWVAEYEITISWNNNANYDVTLVAGTYAITRTDLSVSASGYTGTYDGGEHGITVNLSGNEEAVVYYATTELTKENFSTAGNTTNPTFVNAGTYVVYYYVHTVNYEPIPLKGSQTVNITQAAVTISQIPTASGIIYGQSLSDSTLTGGVATYGGVSVVGTFAWKVGTTKPSVADGNVTEYEVVFTPADAANYVGATCKVKLSVSKADPAYTIPTGLTAVYGQTLGDVGLPTATNGTWSFEDALATSVGNAGTNTFQMTFTPSDVSNYNVITGINITLTVTPATITGVSAANVEVTYDGAEHGITVTGMPEGTIVTYGTSSTAVTQTECPVFVNAANEFYVVYYQVSGSNYVTYSSSATVKINRREVVVSGILAEDKNYDENTNATLKLTQVSFANLVASDVGKLGVTASGSFEDANVGKGKKVLITGLALNGEAAENYVLAASGQQTMAIADISYMTTEVSVAERLTVKIKDFKGEISKVSGLDLTLAKSLLTPAELASYTSGSSIVLELEITGAGSLMTDDVVENVTNALYNQKKVIPDGAQYLDISLYKTVGNGPRTKVTSLGKPIAITLSVPQELRETRWDYLKIFYVVREHAGVADVLFSNNGNELTFESDLFSIYALAYKASKITFYDTTPTITGEGISPKTYGEDMNMWVLIFLGFIFGMAALMTGTYRFRRKRS